MGKGGGREATVSRPCAKVKGIVSGSGWREHSFSIRQPLTLALGRAGHPWPAAAEQGCSTLPDAGLKGKPETGKHAAVHDYF
jgi:hypothetical protein